MGLAISSWEARCAKRDISAVFRDRGIDAAMTSGQIENEDVVFPRERGETCNTFQRSSLVAACGEL
jgi:hypothetical protein